MGTRADFYVGRGESAEWIGSIAWDGHPESIDEAVLKATTETAFRKSLQTFFRRDDATLPHQGWPWPWDDSQTTDYAYAFDGEKVWASNFGHDWFDPLQPQPDDDEESPKSTVFPDMKARQRVTFGKRSGVMVIGPRGVVDAEDD